MNANERNAFRRTFLGTVALAFSCALAWGAGTEVVPASWGESPDGPGVCVPTTPGGFAVSFGALRQPPPPEERLACVVADYGKETSPFMGDYVAGKVRGIRFLATGDGRIPASKYVFLRSDATGRLWYNTKVDFPSTAATATTNNISLDRTAGWYTFSQGDPAAMWVEDIRSVSALGIGLKQCRFSAQTYSIDDFVLVGDAGVTGPAAALAPIQRQALLERFGVLAFGNVDARQKNTDTDGDRLTDYQEILAGTDWKDRRDKFEAKLGESGGEGIRVQWRCVAGGVYNVLWANELTGAFDRIAVDGETDLTPTTAESDAGYMLRVDRRQVGPGPHFYRIVKKQ